jgi:hypothetical protein
MRLHFAAIDDEAHGQCLRHCYVTTTGLRYGIMPLVLALGAGRGEGDARGPWSKSGWRG